MNNFNKIDIPDLSSKFNIDASELVMAKDEELLDDIYKEDSIISVKEDVYVETIMGVAMMRNPATIMLSTLVMGCIPKKQADNMSTKEIISALTVSTFLAQMIWSSRNDSILKVVNNMPEYMEKIFRIFANRTTSDFSEEEITYIKSCLVNGQIDEDDISPDELKDMWDIS